MKPDKSKTYGPDLSLHLWYGKHGTWGGPRYAGDKYCRTCGAPKGTLSSIPSTTPNRAMVTFMVTHHYQATPLWDWLKGGMVGDPPRRKRYFT